MALPRTLESIHDERTFVKVRSLIVEMSAWRWKIPFHSASRSMEQGQYVGTKSWNSKVAQKVIALIAKIALISYFVYYDVRTRSFLSRSSFLESRAMTMSASSVVSHLVLLRGC